MGSVCSSSSNNVHEPTEEKTGKTVNKAPKQPKVKFELDIELLQKLKERCSKKKRREEEKNESKPKEVDAVGKRREKILKVFDKIDEWEFDILRLSRYCGGKPLLYVTYAALLRHDLFKRLNLNEKCVINFLVKIQELYTDAPYSNAIHAADTVQAMHCIIKRGMNRFLSHEDCFAAFIACAIVDLSHPGLDNTYQAHVESRQSTIYNDLSILENNSCSVAFELLSNREYDIFGSMAQSNKADIRETILNMVIATDLANHKHHLAVFNEKVDAVDFTEKKDIRIALEMAIKIADLSHACCRWTDLYKKWTELRLIEKFKQGDLEKKLGLPVSPGCDRNNPNIAKEQIEFLDKKVKPMVKAFSSLVTKTKNCFMYIKSNKSYWQTQYQDEENCIFKSPNQLVNDYEPDQATFEKIVDSRKVPEQEQVIPKEEQAQKIKHPSPDQIENEKFCLETLISRFDVNGGDRQPIVEPKIGCLLDFKKHPNLTPDEIRHSIIAQYDRIDDWNFDVFTLTELLGSEALFLTSHTLFVKYNLIKTFKIPPENLQNLLRKVQEGYQMNPYHNAMHATDVMQVTNCIMTKGGLIEKMSNIDIMSAIISSMVHDLDHPGLNNAFQVNSSSFLATVYNDRSVLENHHCAQTFSLIRDKSNKYNIFQNMKADLRRDARKTMVGMIISTDMTNHGKYITNFNEIIERGADFTEKDDIRVALQIAIKMADVSNPTRPLYLYLQWTEKIIFEFFMQGDKERDFGLPVSPLMDRHSSVLSKGQLAFVQYIIKPMFGGFQSVFPKMKFALIHIDENRSYWENHTQIEKSAFAPGKWKNMHLKNN